MEAKLRMTEYEITRQRRFREEVPYRECPNCGKTKFRERQRLEHGTTPFTFPFRLAFYILNHLIGDGEMPLTRPAKWKTYKSRCSNCKYEEEPE